MKAPHSVLSDPAETPRTKRASCFGDHIIFILNLILLHILHSYLNKNNKFHRFTRLIRVDPRNDMIGSNNIKFSLISL